MIKPPSSYQMREILKEALPSCGIYQAEDLHDEETMDFLVTMTIGQWKALRPEGFQT